ncbi:hypothetical protein ACKI14_02230 [Streptomyces turgidiscabies]|uniref:hypothetical protein n=1 Tax=Streptomyces turgidiscabies TaxID=85558 RepID=UPI0038F6ED36
MADEGTEETAEPQDGEGVREESPQPEEPRAEFRMELRDSLPGGRAVIGVEQEGEFMWLASKKHLTQQAVDEFVEQLSLIVNEGWWVQNWPGARS